MLSIWIGLWTFTRPSCALTNQLNCLPGVREHKGVEASWFVIPSCRGVSSRAGLRVVECYGVWKCTLFKPIPLMLKRPGRRGGGRGFCVDAPWVQVVLSSSLELIGHFVSHPVSSHSSHISACQWPCSIILAYVSNTEIFHGCVYVWTTWRVQSALLKKHASTSRNRLSVMMRDSGSLPADKSRVQGESDAPDVTWVFWETFLKFGPVVRASKNITLWTDWHLPRWKPVA